MIPREEIIYIQNEDTCDWCLQLHYRLDNCHYIIMCRHDNLRPWISLINHFYPRTNMYVVRTKHIKQKAFNL